MNRIRLRLSGPHFFLVATTRRINAYLLVWSGLLLAFAATGVREFGLIPSAPSALGTGPCCASDGLLRYYIGIHGGSEKIQKIIDRFPSMQPEAVFWPEKNGNSSITHLIVSYLSWPRSVKGFGIKPADLAASVDRVRGEGTGGIWVCGFAPSNNLHNWIIVDRGLLYVPAETRK